jgi:hypothetical protein
MADPCEIRLQVKEGQPQTAGRTYGGVQRLHYASNRYAVLLIFQVMEAPSGMSCPASIHKVVKCSVLNTQVLRN